MCYQQLVIYRQVPISMQGRAAWGQITVTQSVAAGHQSTSVFPAEERVGVRSQSRQGDGDVEQQQTKQLILLIRGDVVWRGNMMIISECVCEDACVSRICAVVFFFTHLHVANGCDEGRVDVALKACSSRQLVQTQSHLSSKEVINSWQLILPWLDYCDFFRLD